MRDAGRTSNDNKRLRQNLLLHYFPVRVEAIYYKRIIVILTTTAIHCND